MAEVVSEVFPRRSGRGAFLGLGWAQLVCLAGAGLVLAVGTAGLGLPDGVVVSAPGWAGLAAVALVRVSGRPLVGYVPVVAGFAGRRAGGQHQYRRPVWRTRPAGTLALPGSRARLRQWVDEATGTAMIHDPVRRTLAATLAVGHGQFMVQDSSRQSELADGWGALLNTVGQAAGIRRVQVQVRSEPDAGVGVGDHWRAWPDRAPVGSPVRTSYEELVRSLGAATEAHRSSITIVLDLGRVRGEVRRAGGGLPGAGAVMRRRMRMVEESLQAAGLRPLGWAGPDELAVIIRAAYDPARAVMLERHPDLAGDLVDAGPMAVDAHWAAVRTDSAWHKVMQVGWPRRPAAAGFLHHLLLTPGVRLTVSHFIEPVPSARAVSQAEHAASDEEGAAEERRALGVTETVLHARDRAEADEHLRALDSGWTDAEHAALVVISAPSREELGEAFERVRAAAGRVAGRLDTMLGQQDELLDAAVLPLGVAVR